MRADGAAPHSTSTPGRLRRIGARGPRIRGAGQRGDGLGRAGTPCITRKQRTLRLRFRAVQTLDVAGELATFLDDQFPVADRAGFASRAVDDQPGARRQLAGELSTDLGGVDEPGSIMRAGPTALHPLALLGRLVPAVDPAADPLP